MFTLGLIKRVFKILLNPQFAWVKYKPSGISIKDIIFPIFVPSILILFISRLLGKTISEFASTDFIDIFSFSCAMLVLDIVFFFSVVLIISAITPHYNIKSTKAELFFLVYTSLVPFYISMIIYNLFPGLYFLGIIMLYSFFVFYWGVLNYLKPKKNNSLMIFILFSLIIVGAYLILNFLLIRPFFKFIF